MNSLVFRFRSGRFIWTLLVTVYFLIFFTNFFNDAINDRALIPLIFSYIFVLWLALEYYFGSPFFQSGVVEPNPIWRGLFAFFVYPYFAYLAADFIWWRWTQIPIPHYLLGIIGLLIFGFGAYLRLTTLFSFLRIIQTKPGSDQVLIPPKRLLNLRWHRFCRHPRYLATLIQLFGAALVFNSYGGLILTLVLGFPLILVQARYEEGLLKLQLKSDYEQYSRSVPFLIPKLAQKSR
ncbi:MAG: methyltransferase [candidate division WOR-3 bacterium]